MGTSTDAILAFGIDLGEGEPDFLNGREWEEFVASLSGIEPPDAEYNDESKAAYSAYWTKKNKAAKEFPLELLHHCSGDYPMFFLAINGTERRAYRGSTTVIESPLMQYRIDSKSVAFLNEFCEKYGIEDCNDEPPSWRIFSYWS